MVKKADYVYFYFLCIDLVRFDLVVYRVMRGYRV